FSRDACTAGKTGHGQILLAITVEIGYDHGLRSSSCQRVDHTWLECSVAITEKDHKHLGMIGAAIRDYRQVRFAIPIEITPRPTLGVTLKRRWRRDLG